MEPTLPGPGAAAGLRDVYSVSRLTAEARDLLELTFPGIWVEGEISNLARPASGHLYFSLKDRTSQVRCAMFRGQARRLAFDPGNGQQVVLRARVSLYPARGDFQLIVERMEESGEGALRQAFEELKRRLADEGLFDASRKQPLPSMPGRIGLITSPSGAALRDVLTVLKRRFPSIPVRVYPVTVQGSEAVGDITRAIARAGERQDCDVLVLARGGGSLEDLQVFNDERVARAIHACPLPIVTGIGHEVDFTIADFAADHRAATPSAAAETLAPDQDDLRARLARFDARLSAQAQMRIGRERQRCAWLGKRLRHPRQGIQEQAQRLDNLAMRLAQAGSRLMEVNRQGLRQLDIRLRHQDPLSALASLGKCNRELAHRLAQAWRHHYAGRRGRLAASARALDAVSPLATLERGYAILSCAAQGRILRSVLDAPPPGKPVQARLADGTLDLTLNASHPADPLEDA